MNFTALTGKTDYKIFITAECVLPYIPRVRLSDNQIRIVEGTTPENLNLIDTKEDIVD